MCKNIAAVLLIWAFQNKNCSDVFIFRMLQKSADNSGNASESGPEFAEVFLIVCLGAIVVTLNSSLLGGKMYGVILRQCQI